MVVNLGIDDSGAERFTPPFGVTEDRSLEYGLLIGTRSACLTSALPASKRSSCHVLFSLFPITWGICSSLKANANRQNSTGFGTVLLQLDGATARCICSRPDGITPAFTTVFSFRSVANLLGRVYILTFDPTLLQNALRSVDGNTREIQ